jgi:hypothetical protein
MPGVAIIIADLGTAFFSLCGGRERIVVTDIDSMVVDEGHARSVQDD